MGQVVDGGDMNDLGDFAATDDADVKNPWRGFVDGVRGHLGDQYSGLATRGSSGAGGEAAIVRIQARNAAGRMRSSEEQKEKQTVEMVSLPQQTAALGWRSCYRRHSPNLVAPSLPAMLTCRPPHLPTI